MKSLYETKKFYLEIDNETLKQFRLAYVIYTKVCNSYFGKIVNENKETNMQTNVFSVFFHLSI